MSAYRTEVLKRVDAAGSLPACAVGRGIAAAARTVRRPGDVPLVLRPGGMGDLVLAQIAMEELGADPASALWVVEQRSAAWARHAGLPHVLYDGQPLRTLRRLAGAHRLVVNTEQRFGLSQALAAAAAGRGGRLVAFDTNRGARAAHVRVPYDPYDVHETVAFRLLLAAALGLGADRELRARPRRRPASGPPVVAIAGLQSPSRSLSPERWADLVRPWAAGEPVTVVAAPVDREHAEAVVARLGSQARLAPPGGFGELCDRIASAARLFTMDGGPAHLASYYGVAARVVFTSGRDRKWAPLGEGSSIVRLDDAALPCQPCTLFGQTPPCPNGLACQRLDGVRDARPLGGQGVAGAEPARPPF